MRDAVNLRQLRYFVAVAEEMSFRRAAARIHITQPPLSRQIRALEDRLGTALFERSGRTISLTSKGEIFLGEAREMLRHSESLMTQFRLLDASQEELRLGITTVVDASVFSWLEPEFAARFPGVRLQVKRQISALSIRGINEGQLDAGLIGLPSRTEGLTVARLFDEPMVVGLSAAHPSAKRRRLALRDLAADSLYWFDRKQNPAYHEHCERLFARHNFKPARLIEPADYHVLLSMLAEGRGVALIPRSLRAVKRDGIVYRPLIEGDQLAICVAVAHRTGEASALVTSFVQFVKERMAHG